MRRGTRLGGAADGACLCALLSLGSAGCGGGSTVELHPVGEIAARSEARIELVELIVEDPARAARVRALYLQVGELARRFNRERAAAWAAAAEEGSTANLSAAATRVEESARRTYDEYERIQLELRTLLTAREFARLDQVR